jgi:Nif-specific regulatory protein
VLLTLVLAGIFIVRQHGEDVSEPAPNFGSMDLAVLYRIAKALLNDRDYGELLALVLDETVRALGAERGMILLQEGEVFRATVATNFRSDALEHAEEEISTTIATEVLEHARVVNLGDALSSEQYRYAMSVQRLGLRSVLCAPLMVSDKVFALLYLENRNVLHQFGDQHVRLLGEICALAAPRLRLALAFQEAREQALGPESLNGTADGIITADPGFIEVLQTMRNVARTDLPILVQGETGTGKELVARAIYRHSNRANAQFVVLNCAAIPATLVESELFGYVRGAFTGAAHDKIGFMGAAHRGTLFLDEVGEVPLQFQSRLLRVLQSGEFTRVGSVQIQKVDVRLIAATNRSLEREVEAGTFRRDLYHRLASITLELPPLRERVHDVYLLTEFFLKAHGVRLLKHPPRLSEQCMTTLASYSFPGNVRELEGELARLVAVSMPGAIVAPEALSARIRRQIELRPGEKQTQATIPSSPVSLMSLAEMERKLILAVLETTHGNRTRAADLLGISREGLRLKLQKHGVAAD